MNLFDTLDTTFNNFDWAINTLATGLSSSYRKIQNPEIQYQITRLIPIGIGSYFAYSGLHKLTLATLGYDSLKMRKKWTVQALYNSNLNYVQKASFLGKALFGTAKSEHRSKLLAEAIVRFVVSAALIAPFLAKKTPSQDMFDGLQGIHSNNPAYTESFVQSSSYAYDLKMTEKAYNATQGGGYFHPWKARVIQLEVDPNAQKFANVVLKTDQSQSIVNALKDSSHKICDWTLGYFSDVCDSIKPEPPKQLFTTENGITGIDYDYLETQCQATKEFIQNDPSVTTLGAKMKPYIDSACDVLGQWCHKVKEGVTFEKTLDGKYVSFFQDESVQREKLFSFTESVCHTLKNRPRYQDLFSSLVSFNPTNSETSNFIDQRLKVAEKISNELNTKSENSNFTPLELFAQIAPQKFIHFAQKFFGVDVITSENIKQVNRAFALQVHPDRNPNAAVVFTVGNNIKSAFKGISSETFYTLSEATQKYWQDLYILFNQK